MEMESIWSVAAMVTDTGAVKKLQFFINSINSTYFSITFLEKLLNLQYVDFFPTICSSFERNAAIRFGFLRK